LNNAEKNIIRLTLIEKKNFVKMRNNDEGGNNLIKRDESRANQSSGFCVQCEFLSFNRKFEFLSNRALLQF